MLKLTGQYDQSDGYPITINFKSEKSVKRESNFWLLAMGELHRRCKAAVGM